MGNSISVIMTNAIFNMPTVPSYSESSSKAKYSSWEDKRVPVASARTMMTPGWEVEVELHLVLTLALDASFTP